jgi:hypothetical protein
MIPLLVLFDISSNLPNQDVDTRSGSSPGCAEGDVCGKIGR